MNLTGRQLKAVESRVKIVGFVPADPMEQRPRRLGVLLEDRDRFPVLGLGGRRALDSRQMGLDAGQNPRPDLGTEGGGMPVRELEENGVETLHHRIYTPSLGTVTLRASQTSP